MGYGLDGIAWKGVGFSQVTDYADLMGFFLSSVTWLCKLHSTWGYTLCRLGEGSDLHIAQFCLHCFMASVVDLCFKVHGSGMIR
jgi:hypothetical protein